MYRAVQIHKGSSGWGGPLLIQPDPNKNIVLSVTGGGIHPLAQRIADLTGAKAVDGFKFGVFDKSVAVFSKYPGLHGTFFSVLSGSRSR